MLKCSHQVFYFIVLIYDIYMIYMIYMIYQIDTDIYYKYMSTNSIQIKTINLLHGHIMLYRKSLVKLFHGVIDYRLYGRTGISA